MEIKQVFLKAMADDNGRLSEIELGERLELSADETHVIISRLLDEHKIEFVQNGACSYSAFKKKH